MDLEKEKFRKLFPSLAEEMQNKICETNITSVRSNVTAAEKAVSTKFSGYTPDVIDFIRRCEKTEHAEEIICYLEKRNEITFVYAEKLRQQLRTKGLRSFGSKKEDDYYLRQDGF